MTMATLKRLNRPNAFSGCYKNDEYVLLQINKWILNKKKQFYLYECGSEVEIYLVKFIMFIFVVLSIDYLQAYAQLERSITISTIWAMWTNHEKLGNGHVSAFTLCSLPFVNEIVSKLNVIFFRQIQDPASQRLTWYKPPLAVLVIKKVRDQLVLPPFVQLVEWLIQVSCSKHIVQFNNIQTFEIIK